MPFDNNIRVDPMSPASEAVDAAVRTLRQGGILAVPSDTIYGLSCNAFDDTAVLRISMMKGHPGHRPFVVLFDGSAKWLSRLAPSRSQDAERLRRAHWPGPLTLVLKAGPNAPATVVSEEGGIALRYPRHPLSLEILKSFGGPIVSTSANLMGERPLTTAAEIADAFGAHLDLILEVDGQLNGLASTIVDATGDTICLLREGVLTIT